MFCSCIFQNWVVGKFGRVLPVVYIRRKDKQKVMKVDPSKFCHALTNLDKGSDVKQGGVETLTWEIEEEQNDDKKQKRIGACYGEKKKGKKGILSSDSDSDSDEQERTKQKHVKKPVKVDVEDQSESGDSSDGTEKDKDAANSKQAKYERKIQKYMKLMEKAKKSQQQKAASSSDDTSSDDDVKDKSKKKEAPKMKTTRKQKEANSSDDTSSDDDEKDKSKNKESSKMKITRKQKEMSSGSDADSESDSGSKSTEFEVVKTKAIVKPVMPNKGRYDSDSDDDTDDMLQARKPLRNVKRSSTVAKSGLTPNGAVLYGSDDDNMEFGRARNVPMSQPMHVSTYDGGESSDSETPGELLERAMKDVSVGKAEVKPNTATQKPRLETTQSQGVKESELKVRTSSSTDSESDMDTEEGSGPTDSGSDRDSENSESSGVEKEIQKAHQKKNENLGTLSMEENIQKLDVSVVKKTGGEESDSSADTGKLVSKIKKGSDVKKGSVSESDSSGDTDEPISQFKKRSTNQTGTPVGQKAQTESMKSPSALDTSILSEFSSGFAAEDKTAKSSDDSEDDDLLDMVAAGKFNKLNIMAKNIEMAFSGQSGRKAKTSTHVIEKQTSKTRKSSSDSITKVSQYDTSSKSLETTPVQNKEAKLAVKRKEAIPQVKVVPHKVAENKAEKHAEDNQKRLDSVLQRQKEVKEQKSAIHRALSAVVSHYLLYVYQTRARCA